MLPGVWRLRLPLPMSLVPHGNAWAVATGDGITLFDTGIGGAGRIANLESALGQAGYGLRDVKLVVCTHAHADHYGLAGPIVDASGAELWIHPAWEHVRRSVEDPEGSLAARIEIASQSGVPRAALERYEAATPEKDPEVERLVPPDRELLPGVAVPTDLGAWEVYETPGHAPSHVCLHQPERRLLISGDHLLGRISLYYDYGHTPDPVGEYLGSLDEIRGLDVDLCLPGHGRPFRQMQAKIEATHGTVTDQLGTIRDALLESPKSAFEVVSELVGPERLAPATTAWAIEIVLSYLDHLAAQGEIVSAEEGDAVIWSTA